MNCYDCATNCTTLAAVAVCHDCGAGVCTDHATTTPHRATRFGALNRRVPIEPAARIIRGRTCAAAATEASIA